MLFNNSTSGLLTSDTRDFKIPDVTVFRTRLPGKSLERGRRCKRGKFKLRFATRWTQYQYINPYEGFAKKQKMASFQKIQELLLPCLEEEIIDDEEFSVLYQAYAPQNFPFHHSAYEKFSLKKKILPNAQLIFPSIKGTSHYLLKP